MVAAYLRCKKRTALGRMDILLFLLFLISVFVSWADVASKFLQMVAKYVETAGKGWGCGIS